MVTRSSQGWPPESTLDAGDGSEAEASGLYPTPGERWYQCAHCGFLFRSSDTVIDEVTGFRVCTTGPSDYDNHENDPRVRGNYLSRVYPEEVTE